MNKRYLSNIFSPLLLLAFFVTFGEAFLYTGFLVKHFNILVGVAILGLLIILYIVYRKIGNTKFVKNIPIILVILVGLLYISTNVIENATYQNYIFSHFHVHPESLLLPFILLMPLFSLNEDEIRIRILFYVIIFLIIGQYSINVFRSIRAARPLFILRNINLSYDQKMEMMMGKLFYDYAAFIKNNTPEKSTILIPPQGFPWPQTGNVGYLRYLLFPRNLINGNEKDSKVGLGSVDYVLIDYGESTISEYGFTNIWPKFNVEGEYILYWNPLDETIRKVDNGKYVYSPDKKTEEWGIVKIKK